MAGTENLATGFVWTERDISKQGIWDCEYQRGDQSGGRHCARLFQAWGLLEERKIDYAASNPNAKSQTGFAIFMGKALLFVASRKEKCV